MNAPLTPEGREMMVRAVLDCGLSRAAAARRFNATPKTVVKWVKRFRAEGVDGLRDRSSRPRSLPSQTTPAACATVEALRRQRHTGQQIAVEAGEVGALVDVSALLHHAREVGSGVERVAHAGVLGMVGACFRQASCEAQHARRLQLQRRVGSEKTSSRKPSTEVGRSKASGCEIAREASS